MPPSSLIFSLQAGSSALHLAAQHGRREVVEVLLRHRADADGKDAVSGRGSNFDGLGRFRRLVQILLNLELPSAAE